jgi:ribosomal protein S18 acetylase RimI-like enzyme
MKIRKIYFRVDTAKYDDLHLHLQECNDDFYPPLNLSVDLAEYSKKLIQNAVIFEAWDNRQLVGCVAVYFNDSKKECGYITNVSVLPQYYKRGIGNELFKKCIEYASSNSFNHMELKVNEQNIGAIKLYDKHNFEKIGEAKDEIIQMHLKISLRKELV